MLLSLCFPVPHQTANAVRAGAVLLIARSLESSTVPKHLVNGNKYLWNESVKTYSRVCKACQFWLLLMHVSWGSHLSSGIVVFAYLFAGGNELVTRPSGDMLLCCPAPVCCCGCVASPWLRAPLPCSFVWGDPQSPLIGCLPDAGCNENLSCST